MRRILWAMLIGLGLVASAHAQIDALNGFCEQGGVSAATQGLNSTNKLNGIVPSCTINVYLTGTLTRATLYSNSSSTPLSNPFTAAALGSSAPGQWLFYAATGTGYDVVMSGGITPLVFTQPVTLTDLKVGGGSGGGGISALIGDVTAAGTGTVTATLATVNTGPGLCGDATDVCQITTNGKGLVTSQSAIPITSLLTSVSNSDGTLTISPTTGAVIASLALAHANTWSALQTHNAGINLTGGSSPLELGGSAGTAGQCPISAGAGATPAWGACGGGGGGTIAHTTLVLKGDNTGNAVAAAGIDEALTAALGTTGNIVMTTTIPPNIGNNNLVIGVGAGAAMNFSPNTAGTSSYENVLLGYLAGEHLTTQNFDVLIGSQAGASLTGTGVPTEDGINVCIGAGACQDLTIGVDNVYLGEDAGSGATGTSSSNTVLGTHAGDNITTSNNNILIGHSAMGTIGTGITVTDDIVIGTDAASFASGSNNDNTIIGHDAANDFTTGVFNIIIGSLSQPGFTSGTEDVAIGGTDNGGTITTGSGNTTIGWDAGTHFGATGDQIAIGRFSNSDTGAGNIEMGAFTGAGATQANVLALGANACNGMTGGSNVCLGVGARNPGTSGTNSFDILLGVNASIAQNINNAAQIGAGTNSTSGTLQFLSTQLVNAGGKIPSANLSAPSTTVNGQTCTLGSTCTIAGTGGITGLTAGFLPIAGSATTLTGNSHIDDGVTTGAILTATEPIHVVSAAGPSSVLYVVNGVAPATTASAAGWGVNTTLTTPGYYLMPDAPCSGLVTFTNSAGIVTTTCSAPSTGTVSSIATTGPITGGTITTTGTIACATCVVASSPGAGIAHFAGSTQTVTSSAVSLTADVTGVLPVANGGSPPIANITVAMPTSLIAANTCTSPATATMTGLATSSTFTTAFATNPNAVTGWGSSGGLLLTAWPTANTLNWSVCNPTASGITPGAMTINVGAR